MTTFALVHGGYHDAWCWGRLTPLLQQAGNGVVTMDLPLEDSTATFDTYADVVCSALDDCGDDVVLVGHSYAGNTIPLVAARRPVRHLVFLCAMIPDVGRSLVEQLTDKPEMLNPIYEQGLSALDDQLCQRWIDLGIARDIFYFDCDEQIAQAALGRLRPQSVNPALFPFSLTEHPTLPTTYVVCSDDRMLRPEWSLQAVRERLDAELIELPGGHSPMLSQPQVLADLLLRLAI
ncbi:MAG: alpha/beta fold hydrolase [Mycobacterium sp.]